MCDRRHVENGVASGGAHHKKPVKKGGVRSIVMDAHTGKV